MNLERAVTFNIQVNRMARCQEGNTEKHAAEGLATYRGRMER
jgi:hypothetical protein